MTCSSLGVLVLGIIVCGCSQVREVSTGPGDQMVLAAMDELTGKEVEVKLQDGREYEGIVAPSRADSFRVALDNVQRVAIPFSTIDNVRTIRHERTLGLVVGIVAGGVVGGTLGAVAAAEEQDSSPMVMIDPATTGGITGGVIGALVGALIGSHIPPGDVYRFRTPISDTLVVLVDQVIEDSERYTNVRLGEREYTLPKSEFTFTRLPDGTSVKGLRSSFRKLGVPIP